MSNPLSSAAPPATDAQDDSVGPQVEGGARGFLRGYVVDPLLRLLDQGLSPEKLALSLALGAVFGIFPVLGATSALCVLAGFLFRLNHPVLQVVNYAVYPLQVPLVLAFVRVGERLLGAPPVSFSPVALLAGFQQDPSRFLAEFGVTGLRGILGWSVVAPFVGLAFYFSLLFALRRLLSRK